MRIILRWQWRPRNHGLRGLLVSAGGILLLVAALQALAFREFAEHLKRSTAQNTALTVPAVLPAEVIVSEARLVGPSERRRIAGVLKNRSGKTYTNIQATFSQVGPDGDTLGWSAVTVDRIGGYETAQFEASDVNPQAVEIVLQRIETHPPLAGAR